MRKLQGFIIVVIVVVAVVAVVAVGIFQQKKPVNQSNTAFLEKYGLSGLSVEEIVHKLDNSTSDPSGLSASITSTELVLMDNLNEVKLPLPKDKFYLSFAPYVTQTHPCGTHSLTGCQGELVKQDVRVVVTDSEGKEVINTELTTMANGFVGVWLPGDIDAVLMVSYDGMVAQAPIRTFAGSDTCLTTPLQLH